MKMLTESWCFCKGVSKSERMKAAIFSGKSPAMAKLSGGSAFLIHRNLLLTTHANLPSLAAAEIAEICLHNGVAATLVPHRFFITSSVLDLTIVGLDPIDTDLTSQLNQPHYLKTCSKPNLDLGSVVYLLGYTSKNELIVGEGKVVIATDNLIKLSTDGVIYNPGSAGFDMNGNLAFMICDPMKLATSPNTKSSSTSSSSSSTWKKETPLQFGVPVPIVCDWLNHQWEGNLDELTKPKLPLIRLMSTGQKSEYSSASFTKRPVFKSADGNTNNSFSTPSSSFKSRDQLGVTEQEITKMPDERIPTTQVYDSPKLPTSSLRKTENPVQLLDINFPPRTGSGSSQPIRNLSVKLGSENPKHLEIENPELDSPIATSTGSINPVQSEVMSSASPLPDQYNHSSEGEETMYSAETAESRNYTSPRERKFAVQVGRSQSCVNHDRNAMASRRREMLEKQRSLIHGKKAYSNGRGINSQRSNEYINPTVSSIMKKRNNSAVQTRKPRQSAVHSSPKWVF